MAAFLCAWVGRGRSAVETHPQWGFALCSVFFPSSSFDKLLSQFQPTEEAWQLSISLTVRACLFFSRLIKCFEDSMRIQGLGLRDVLHFKIGLKLQHFWVALS